MARLARRVHPCTSAFEDLIEPSHNVVDDGPIGDQWRRKRQHGRATIVGTDQQLRVADETVQDAALEGGAVGVV